MSRIVVLGAGVCGLAAALMLRRDGHEVTVLERDSAPLPDSAADAWHSWEREGVRQFRQAHFLQPLGAGVLDAELPDVRDAALAVGAAHFSVLPDVFPYEPGDERFRTFIMRRAVLEHTLARIAEDEVDVRRGVVATGLVSNGRVAGVRTRDGELAADLVVDAMGRRSPLSQWRDDIHEEADDSGFLYYSRFFRGAQPEILAPLLSEAGTISFLTLPGDNGTWSVTLFVSAGDQPLKRVRETDRWSAVVAASPAHAHWLDGEPTSEIEAMGGINDRFRRLAPGTLGLALLADACACTNPSNGRGLALGLRHAQQLRDAARNEDPARFAEAFAAATAAELEPWYRTTVREDRERLAEIEALRDGRTPAPTLASIQAAAAQCDPALLRAFLAQRCCLGDADALERPELAERIAACAAEAEPPPPRVPDRQTLLALLT